MSTKSLNCPERFIPSFFTSKPGILRNRPDFFFLLWRPDRPSLRGAEPLKGDVMALKILLKELGLFWLSVRDSEKNWNDV